MKLLDDGVNVPIGGNPPAFEEHGSRGQCRGEIHVVRHQDFRLR